VIMGPPPLPDRIDLVLVLLGQGVALALGIWMVIRNPTTMSELAAVTVSTGLVNGRCKSPWS